MKIPSGYTIRFPREGGPPGEHGSIAFNGRYWKMFNKVDAKARAQLEAAMRTWCRFGPLDMPDSKFKFEGRHRKGGKNIRIVTFKGWQVRFYGTTVEVKGKAMFLITEADLAKKQNAADETKLQHADEVAAKLIQKAEK